MLSELLNNRNLPALLPREQMLDILREEVYGAIPEAPDAISFTVTENIIRKFCAGKAVCNKITADCTVHGKAFSFPFYAAMPTDGKRHPFFVHINFRDCIPDLFMPTEELIDNGFAVLSFCYNDVTADNDDFTDGLARILYPDGIRQSNSTGKIAMWAWAAQRVMDYAQTLDGILDLNNSVVCGHSRLGKTALLAAATDARFAFAYSNDSGCSGAAIARGTRGETIKNIYQSFPYWFCPNYQKYIDNEQAMPFDQHYLLAAIAPRKVLVGSASEDLWADPISEQLCCAAAAQAFPNGFHCPNRLADIGEAFLEGDIGYHLRPGTHYFSREDWHRLIEFVTFHHNT